MATTIRSKAAHAVFSLVERILDWAPLIGGTVTTSALSGWAAHVTAPLAAYAPLSWVGCAILGALAFVFFYWLWATARLLIQRHKIHENFLQEKHDINPLDNIFTRKRININDFTPLGSQYWRDKTFVDCDIYGPACIILNGITSLQKGGMEACDFVKVKVNHPINNAIGFENLTLRNCRLYKVTILVPEYMVPQFPSGPNWITP
jgi:hypothetical protein